MKAKQGIKTGLILGLTLLLFGSCKEEELYTIEEYTKLACTFHDKSLPNGQSVTAYSAKSLVYDAKCSSVAEIRTCNDGELSGTFEFNSCVEEPPATCTFDNKSVAHGEGVAAFQSSSLDWSLTRDCDDVGYKETRTCDNGTLAGTFTHPSCTEKDPIDCPFDGTTVGHMQFTTAFEFRTYPYGGSCRTEQRYCENGVLKTGSYQYAAPGCQRNPADNCTYEDTGAKVAHGTINLTNYTTALTDFNARCDTIAYSNNFVACDNGKFNPEQFKYQSCSDGLPDNCTLKIPGSSSLSTVKHDNGSLTAYRAPTVPHGTVNGCSTKAVTATCWNGNFVDDNITQNTLFASNDYWDNCSFGPPANCTSNLRNINNELISFNHDTIEDAFINKSVLYGQSCPLATRVKCNNSNLEFIPDNGSDPGTLGYRYNACEPAGPAGCNGEDAGPAWTGKVFNSGDNITAYQFTSSAFGSCGNIETRTCTNGSWGGSFPYSNCLDNFTVVGARGTSTNSLDVTWIPYDSQGAYYKEYKYNSGTLNDMIEIDKDRDNVTIKITKRNGVLLSPEYTVSYGSGTKISGNPATSGTANLLVSVLIDNSDSMTGNDADNLRYGAVETLIDQVPIGTTFNIRDFSGEAYIGMLVREQTVSDNATRNQIKADVKANSDSAVTPLYKYMQTRSILEASAVDKARKMLITLTDGIDTTVFSEPGKYTADKVITEANNQKIEIHNIGLGSSIDSKFKSMPNGATEGGSYRNVDNASELAELFNNLGKTASVGYARLAGITSVNLDNDSSGTLYEGTISIRSIPRSFQFTR